MPRGEQLCMPGSSLRSQLQQVQHVQVRRRKSIRLLKTGNGNVSWPLAALWAASSHPLTDFGFSGRQLKLQWGEAEILITWRITVFTVRGIFTIIHIGTFQRSTNLLPLRPHVLHVHVGHAPLRVRKQWARHQQQQQATWLPWLRSWIFPVWVTPTTSRSDGDEKITLHWYSSSYPVLCVDFQS